MTNNNYINAFLVFVLAIIIAEAAEIVGYYILK